MPALRSPANKVVSAKARVFGDSDPHKWVDIKRAMLE